MHGQHTYIPRVQEHDNDIDTCSTQYYCYCHKVFEKVNNINFYSNHNQIISQKLNLQPKLRSIIMKGSQQKCPNCHFGCLIICAQKWLVFCIIWLVCFQRINVCYCFSSTVSTSNWNIFSFVTWISTACTKSPQQKMKHWCYHHVMKVLHCKFFFPLGESSSIVLSLCTNVYIEL